MNEKKDDLMRNKEYVEIIFMNGCKYMFSVEDAKNFIREFYDTFASNNDPCFLKDDVFLRRSEVAVLSKISVNISSTST